MSCTDDKNPCPCEPELRRFEAADLKAAVLGTENEDGETWFALENGVYVPNEEFCPELDVEGKRLYEVWRTHGQFRSQKQVDHEARDAAYAAYVAFRAKHGTKLNEHKTVPWTFKWNGKELPVKVVQDNGGTEGGGEAVHMVYQVCDRLFRLDGSYYSYDGTTWDDDSFREVKPVVKQVTFYE